MKKLILIAFLFSSTSALAVDYYACDCQAGADAQCQPGIDSNAGTSPNSPWRTYDHAQDEFPSMQGGDSIQFCRGGSFNITGSARWSNENASANNRITIRDYTPTWGSGNEGRPIITSPGGSAFAFDDSGRQSGFNILNLELRGSGDGRGVFLYNDKDDFLLDNLLIDGFSAGVYSRGQDHENERVTFRNSTVINNGGQGWQGGGSEFIIENNYFENNGFYRANLNHNIYFSGDGSDDVIIRGNTLYRSTILNGQCEGVSLVLHGTVSNVTIEENTVREDIGAVAGRCYGIAVDAGYTAAEQFDNLIIRRNTVINVGRIGIGCQTCTNALIENNVVITNQDSNDITSTGIQVPDKLGTDPEDATTTNVTVRNNSIYFGPNSDGTGIRVGHEGGNHTVVSNAVYYSGSGSGWDCFNFDLPVGSYNTIDNNMCYYPNSSGGWEVGTGSLSQWQANTPFGDNSINDDPVFIEPVNFDLSISNNSRAINAGHPTLSSTVDIAGNPRVGIPDIGAFESGSNLTSPPPPPSPDDPELPGSSPEAEVEGEDEPAVFKNVLSMETGNQIMIPCSSTADIYNRLGNLVVSLPCGADFVTWDGRNNSGENVSSGVYILIERSKGNRKVVVIK